MPESRRKFDQDFKEGAVRLVRETGRPIARVGGDSQEVHATGRVFDHEQHVQPLQQ